MVEINDKTRSKIDLALVAKVAEAVLLLYKKQRLELSIAFVGDRVMARLNQQYRGKLGPTDVLSFEGEGSELGEVIIDFQQIKRQAERLGHSAKKELIFILVHGILHLLGYEDDTEQKRLAMIRLGEDVIKKINLK